MNPPSSEQAARPLQLAKRSGGAVPLGRSFLGRFAWNPRRGARFQRGAWNLQLSSKRIFVRSFVEWQSYKSRFFTAQHLEPLLAVSLSGIACLTYAR